ncbi:MAG: DUF4956 domain-containing protein [Bacteroidaceae bacterium]
MMLLKEVVAIAGDTLTHAKEIAAHVAEDPGLDAMLGGHEAGGAAIDDLFQLLTRYIVNIVVVGLIIHFFYYPKSKNREYYVSFSLINISVFLLIFLLGGVKLKIGFALGIFAIFGIIRYRTESVAIREMTYLFLIIAISVINALSIQISLWELIGTNSLFLISVFFIENIRWIKSYNTKIIRYDKIDLITPDKRDMLTADLKKRTGLDIRRVEVGSIDFLKDTVLIRISYISDQKGNAADQMTRLPKEGEPDSF